MRDWLSKNKIIFETIAATLLSLMAVVVSFLTYRVTSRQTNLIGLQTEIARQQVAPQFVVQKLQVQSSDGIYHDDRMVITNKGAIARAAEVDDVEFITLRCSRIGAPPKKLRLPVINYYGVNLVSSRPELEFTLENRGNNDQYASLYTGLMNLDSKSATLVEIGMDIYVRVNYQDLLDQKHSDYFWAKGRTAAEHIPQKEGQAAFQEHDEGLTKEMLAFPKLTADELHKKCEQ